MEAAPGKPQGRTAPECVAIRGTKGQVAFKVLFHADKVATPLGPVRLFEQRAHVPLLKVAMDPVRSATDRRDGHEQTEQKRQIEPSFQHGENPSVFVPRCGGVLELTSRNANRGGRRSAPA